MSDTPAERQEQFLEAFIESDGDLDKAREAVNLSKLTFYRWLREDETFRKRFDEYRLTLAEKIENEAIRRVLNPEGQRGSDALATTLLKGLKKERYGDVDKNHVGPNIVYISGLREKPRPGVEPPPAEAAGALPAPEGEPVAADQDQPS